MATLPSRSIPTPWVPSSCPAGSHSPLLSRVGPIGRSRAFRTRARKADGDAAPWRHGCNRRPIEGPSRSHQPHQGAPRPAVLIYLSSSADEDGGHTVFPSWQAPKLAGGARPGMAHTVARALIAACAASVATRALSSPRCRQVPRRPPPSRRVGRRRSACTRGSEVVSGLSGRASEGRHSSPVLARLPKRHRRPVHVHAGCLANTARWALQG